MAEQRRVALRPATDADADFLWRLHVAAMRPYVEATWGWDEALQLRRFRDRGPLTATEVIERDGEPIGAIRIRREPAQIVVASIEVDPSAQRQGIGTTVLRCVLAEADRGGVPVVLQVLKVNPGRGPYERLGFLTVDESKTHFRMRRDPASDR